MKKTFFHVECGYEIEKKGETPALFNQVHGNQIVELHGSPSTGVAQAPLPDADGAFSKAPFAELHVYTADCIPLLFFSEDKQGPIGAIHAGWRGVKLGIISRALTFFSERSDVHVVIGPSIGACCFAVREDFVQEWDRAGLKPELFLKTTQQRTYFDLMGYVLAKELQNLPPTHVHLDFYRCTVCSTPELPSFRRNKSANPRLRSFIQKLG